MLPCVGLQALPLITLDQHCVCIYINAVLACYGTFVSICDSCFSVYPTSIFGAKLLFNKVFKSDGYHLTCSSSTIIAVIDFYMVLKLLWENEVGSA